LPPSPINPTELSNPAWPGGDIMHKSRITLTLVAFVVSGALPLPAQQKRVSPHETTGRVIEGNRVTVIYGRPYTKDPKTGEPRKIWGGLVPYGAIWRTGADEATLLVTQQPIVLGGTTVPAGAYSLWTLPAEDGTAKLIVNKQIGQWGINPRNPSQVYDQSLDVVRVDLKKEPLDPPVHQFTMAVEKNPAGGGLLKLAWEDVEYSVSFTVPK
jgi:hypothetical protein